MSQSLTQEIQNLNDAVYDFAEKMRQRLEEKARAGYRGWDDKAFEQTIIKDLLNKSTLKLLSGDHKQAVDVANLAMMLDKINCKD